MKKYYLTLLVILLPLCTLFSQEKIRLFSENKTTGNALKISEFFFVHVLFSEAFYMTQLNNELSPAEMHSVLDGILNKIDIDNPVYLEIKRKEGNPAKFNFLVMESPKAKVLVMRTNFDSGNETFAEEITDDTWMRFYIIEGEKLVHNSDLFTAEAEDKAKNEEPYTLIGFYMFDNKSDNDNKIKPLIDKILNDTTSEKLDILYTKLHLGEYHLMNADLAAAEKEVKSLRAYFDANKGDGIPENYALLPNMAETELEIMKLFGK